MSGRKAEPGSTGRKPVLLLHGASGNHRTFLEPHGGLAAWLAVRGFDPWLLDWRGSGLVVDNPANKESLSKNGRAFNFNLAAQHDVRRAIKTIRHETRNEQRVAALGFCMGSAILAEAVALKHISHDDVDCVVLMTLGLFYETAIDGRLKSDDRILERLRHHRRDEDRFVRVDPRVAKSGISLREPWPSDLERMYSGWPTALKSHEDEPADPAPPHLDPLKHMCNRLSFMYGMPYHHSNLADPIHAEAHGGTPMLEEMFGAIPLQMYLHGARNIRKRHATYFEPAPGAKDAEFVSDAARQQFRKLEKSHADHGRAQPVVASGQHRSDVRMVDARASGLSPAVSEARPAEVRSPGSAVGQNVRQRRCFARSRMACQSDDVVGFAEIQRSDHAYSTGVPALPGTARLPTACRAGIAAASPRR